ncbi:MAG: ABC transporter ATP-binding protein [Pararhodobacter sp.]|nr:ABC transporter ATP-binding protein [Pararhodobacter sp.]
MPAPYTTEQGAPRPEEAVDALSVENLEVVYHHTIQVLKGLSLRVPQGQIVALLGSNGAGKSTTLKAISGLLPLERGHIETGRVLILGKDAGTSPPHVLARRGLAHVREGRCIFPDLTVEENLIAGSYALPRGKPDYDIVYNYFPKLTERRKLRAGFLSGGEQQMLAIGRALVAQPSLMLLDEPSLGLAPRVVAEIFGIIERVNREQNTAILLVEQNAVAALSIASYGYILEEGRVMLDGTVDALLDSPDVQRFYLGHGTGSDGAVQSYRTVKHYKRRKRWLS